MARRRIIPCGKCAKQLEHWTLNTIFWRSRMQWKVNKSESEREGGGDEVIMRDQEIANAVFGWRYIATAKLTCQYIGLSSPHQTFHGSPQPFNARTSSVWLCLMAGNWNISKSSWRHRRRYRRRRRRCRQIYLPTKYVFEDLCRYLSSTCVINKIDSFVRNAIYASTAMAYGCSVECAGAQTITAPFPRRTARAKRNGTLRKRTRRWRRQSVNRICQWPTKHDGRVMTPSRTNPSHRDKSQWDTSVYREIQCLAESPSLPLPSLSMS